MFFFRLTVANRFFLVVTIIIQTFTQCTSDQYSLDDSLMESTFRIISSVTEICLNKTDTLETLEKCFERKFSLGLDKILRNDVLVITNGIELERSNKENVPEAR